MTVPSLRGGVATAWSPQPDDARDRVARELSRPEYQESLSERLVRWVNDLLDALQEASTRAGGLRLGVAVLALAGLVVLLAVALSRLRTSPEVAAADTRLFAEPRSTAADHRARAAEAVRGGDWETTVVESTRALAAGLFERGLVPETAGITVHELGEHAAALFPDHGSRIAELASLFDATRYGDRTTDEEHARTAVSLEADLATATPRTGRATGPVPAVPR